MPLFAEASRGAWRSLLTSSCVNSLDRIGPSDSSIDARDSNLLPWLHFPHRRDLQYKQPSYFYLITTQVKKLTWVSFFSNLGKLVGMSFSILANLEAKVLSFEVLIFEKLDLGQKN